MSNKHLYQGTTVIQLNDWDMVLIHDTNPPIPRSLVGKKVLITIEEASDEDSGE